MLPSNVARRDRCVCTPESGPDGRARARPSPWPNNSTNYEKRKQKSLYFLTHMFYTHVFIVIFILYKIHTLWIQRQNAILSSVIQQYTKEVYPRHTHEVQQQNNNRIGQRHFRIYRLIAGNGRWSTVLRALPWKSTITNPPRRHQSHPLLDAGTGRAGNGRGRGRASRNFF